MSYYLIGIGGTGARCMEAFIHLNGAGLLKDSQPVKIIYVDADVSCGNLTKAQHAADLYNEAAKLGFGDSGLMKNKLELYKPWTPVPEGSRNLDDIFESKRLANVKEYKGLDMLYQSLFSEKERTTDLAMGFRGHPAIGAAVMSKAMICDKNEQWETIFQNIKTDKDPRIFLFASVFGGTGAAGFPTIARIIERILKKDGNKQIVAKIGGALLLPYFQFPLAQEALEEELQAKVADFFLNTRAALDYYNKSNLTSEIFKCIYLVGDSSLASTKSFSLGANSQKNEASFVELYAALAAFDFFNRAEFPEENITPMIARGDDVPENANKLAWEDLPNPCVDGALKNKLDTYLKFMYTYRHCVYLNLDACSKDESKKRTMSWYIDLVEKAGKIDVYRDTAIMNRFKALDEYAAEFFSWLEEICTSSNREIELVNKQVFEDPAEKPYQIDAYQVVLPIISRKGKLTKKEFWNNLCKYYKSDTMKNSASSGAAILMQAVYDSCR